MSYTRTRLDIAFDEGIYSPKLNGIYKDNNCWSSQNNYTTNNLTCCPSTGKPNINIIGASSMGRVGPAFGGNRM